MRGRVVSDIQSRAEGERWSDATRTRIFENTCDTNGCKPSYTSKILEIGMILGEKIERKVDAK